MRGRGGFWGRLRRWGRRPPPQLEHVEIVMLTRQGCHLCSAAWSLLEEARQRYGFTLRLQDVDTDERLVAAFGNCVPVVMINGKVRFRGTVNPVLLERLLKRS